MKYDAVVIGAGHNGLIASFYLASAGLKTVVVERREVIGGAAVTEEFHPGFKVSVASYSLSLLRPDIHRDMRLVERGVVIKPKDPQMFVPFPDGRHFFVWRDEERTAEELRQIYPPDADAYKRWNAFWEETAQSLRQHMQPGVLAHRSAADLVGDFFESDEVRGAFASQGIIGTRAGPRTPGTAWVMAYHALGGEVNGATGTWGYVMGGMGALTQAMADAARDAGAEIRLGAEVEQVIVENGRATGVALRDGSAISAKVVVSNADPIRTSQLAPSAIKVDDWRTDGCVVKVNLALDQLPDFTSMPGSGPQHHGTISISPSIEYLEEAFDDAGKGSFSRRPFMEAFVQSAVDPDVAPAGKHVMSVFSQYAPEGGGTGAKESVISTLAAYAPNLPDAVIAAQVLGPVELEAKFGLTGGDIFHGSMLQERLPYETALPGLYLCGSGAHPGGGVMGAAGQRAARTILSQIAVP